jgi:cob(I)alamin adenosyltransferase
MIRPLTPENITRHAKIAAKRKVVQDAEVASKPIERKGLLMVHTGSGKGKSTAAFGMALRALGHGQKVGIVQFIKGAWSTGEQKALQIFGDYVIWHSMGDGFTWETQDLERDIAAASRAWERAKELLSDRNLSLVILDEINIALRYDYLSLEDVILTLNNRRADLHVIVTGRNAKPELLDIADLITEMNLIKHHFKNGVKAQTGIEF